MLNVSIYLFFYLYYTSYYSICLS